MSLSLFLMSIVLCTWCANISTVLQAWAFSTLFCFSLDFLHVQPGNTEARKLQRTERAGRSKLGITTFRVFLSGPPAVGQFWIQSPTAINFVCSDCWRVKWRNTLPSLSSVTRLPPFQISPFFSLIYASPTIVCQDMFILSQRPPSFFAFSLCSSLYLLLVSHDHFREITLLISAIDLLKWVIPFTGILKEKKLLWYTKQLLFFFLTSNCFGLFFSDAELIL